MTWEYRWASFATPASASVRSSWLKVSATAGHNNSEASRSAVIGSDLPAEPPGVYPPPVPEPDSGDFPFGAHGTDGADVHAEKFGGFWDGEELLGAEFSPEFVHAHGAR